MAVNTMMKDFKAEKPKAQTASQLLANLSRDFPGHEALVDGDTRYTFFSLWADVRSFARGLLALGVKSGDHVAILMGNRAEWIVADMAVASIGAVMASVSTYVTGKELQYILNHSDADFLIYEPSFMNYDYVKLLHEIGPLSEALPRLRGLIGLGNELYPGSVDFAEVYTRGKQVTEEELDAVMDAVVGTDTAALLYTSGSTSTPKGVQIAHGDAIGNMWHIGERMHIVPGDRFWCAVSLFWGFGCMNILYNAFTHAACVVLQRSFDAGEALRMLEAEKCTVIYAFPNMVAAMMDHPDYSSSDLSALRTGGTGGTPEQIRTMMDMGAAEICQLYGLTETYGNCAVVDGRNDPLEKRLTTCGRPLPGAVVRIVDPESNTPKAIGEVGEIQVLKPVTPGYYKDEDKNREAFLDDGYFRTGDLGRIDEDGYLVFEGRLKDMIKVGGINVSPAEVESVLMEDAAIAAAYVVAVPDEIRGEIVGAVVIPNNRSADREALEAAMRARMKADLSAYKRPSRYLFVSEAELPLTTTGKVKRNEIFRLFD